MQNRLLIGWGLGSFTSALLVSTVGLLHLRFMTDSLGIGIGIAGMLVVLSRIYDALSDPVMGFISDRTSTRWGRYRPYILAGAALAACSLVLMFNVPRGLSVNQAVAFSAVVLILYATAYTMYRIPYLALGRAITGDFSDRSRLMAFSVYGSSLGALTATSLAPLLLTHLGSDRGAHGSLAWVVAPLVLLGGLATFLFINREGQDDPAGSAGTNDFTLLQAIRAVVGNLPFRNLIVFKLAMFASLALQGAAIPYYTRHVLHAADTSLSSIFLAKTLLMMASQPLWVRIAARFGRRRGLMTAALAEAVLMLGWFLIPVAQPSPWMQILGGLEGVALGGIMFGLYTVLTDIMDDTREKQRANGGDGGQEGMLAGVFVMVEKATTAIGTFLFSMVMSYAGFVSAADAGAAQAPGVSSAIVFSVSIAPALVAGLACLFLRDSRGDRPSGKSLGATAAGILAFLAAGGLFLAPSPASAAEETGSEAGLVIKRIVADEDGRSRLEDFTLPRAGGSAPDALVARLYATDVEISTAPPGIFIDWHRVSTPRLLIVLSGTMEIGTGDGRLHLLQAGDFALAMDTTGQGHTSRTVGSEPVTAMTVRLPKDDPLQSRESSCSDGVIGADCVANGLVIQRNQQ